MFEVDAWFGVFAVDIDIRQYIDDGNLYALPNANPTHRRLFPVAPIPCPKCQKAKTSRPSEARVAGLFPYVMYIEAKKMSKDDKNHTSISVSVDPNIDLDH